MSLEVKLGRRHEHKEIESDQTRAVTIRFAQNISAFTAKPLFCEYLQKIIYYNPPPFSPAHEAAALQQRARCARVRGGACLRGVDTDPVF